jgi:hypothetical protein
MRAAYRHNGIAYFSTFQTYQAWQVYELGDRAPVLEVSIAGSGFEALVRLLTKIQDFYLPEIRSDQRFGEFHDYYSEVAIGGTYFNTRTQYMLSSICEWRHRNIKEGYFAPTQVFADTELDIVSLTRWITRLASTAESIDPLSAWRILVKYLAYSKRQKLKFEALLAQDLYEMAELLNYFVADVDPSAVVDDPSDLWNNYPRDLESNRPSWKIATYGDSLPRPMRCWSF